MDYIIKINLKELDLIAEEAIRESESFVNLEDRDYFSFGAEFVIFPYYGNNILFMKNE